jgi:hypothetical protein
MKKTILTLLLLAFIAVNFTSCKPEKEESTEEVEEVIEETGDSIEDAADEVEDAADDVEDDM